jgi:hypothetical protein
MLGGGFSLEMDHLLLAVLCLIELGSLVYIFHSVAQHAVGEPGEFGGHGLDRHRRPQPSPKSAELRPQIAVALPKVFVQVSGREVILRISWLRPVKVLNYLNIQNSTETSQKP